MKLCVKARANMYYMHICMSNAGGEKEKKKISSCLASAGVFISFETPPLPLFASQDLESDDVYIVRPELRERRAARASEFDEFDGMLVRIDESETLKKGDIGQG